MVHRCPAAGTHSDVTSLDRLRRRLEERRVDDPDEGPPRFVNQAQPPPDLQPGGTQQALGLRAQTSSEEDTVTRPGADLPDQSRTLGFGEVPGDRANSCQASNCRRGWLAPPSITTAPT